VVKYPLPIQLIKSLKKQRFKPTISVAAKPIKPLLKEKKTGDQTN